MRRNKLLIDAITAGNLYDIFYILRIVSEKHKCYFEICMRWLKYDVVFDITF